MVKTGATLTRRRLFFFGDERVNMAHQSSCEEDYVGDAEILRLLEESRQAFEAGNKYELLMCVFRCAAFQAVIPEWAADALIALRESIENGRVADFNDAFGKPREKLNTRAARARIKGATPLVLGELLRLRTLGRSLNDPEMFSEVVDNLRGRGVNVNHRDVQTIYKSDGHFLKAVSRVPDPKVTHGSSYVTYPKARRRGRNILRD
jgi:hypothetical protein